MKALAVFCICLGVMAMLSLSIFNGRGVGNQEHIAVNYGVYRNAVFEYVIKNPTAFTSIPLTNLKLPVGWQALRSWQHSITAGNPRVCYVYGPASMEEINAVRTLFVGSFAVGYKQNGKLQPVHGVSVPLPALIPDGSLVSVIEVTP